MKVSIMNETLDNKEGMLLSLRLVQTRNRFNITITVAASCTNKEL